MKKTLALVIVATMLLSLFAVFGTVSATEADPNEYVAHRFETAPTIDGVISAGEWDGAATYVIKGGDNLDYVERYWGSGSGFNYATVVYADSDVPYAISGDSTIYITWMAGQIYVAGHIADTTIGGNAYNGGMAGTHYWNGGGPIGDFFALMLRNNETKFQVATNGTNKKDHDPGDFSSGGSGMEDSLLFVLNPFPKGNADRDGAVAPALLEMWCTGQVINSNVAFGAAAATADATGYTFEYVVNMGIFSAWGVRQFANWWPDYKFNDNFSLTEGAKLYFTPVIGDAAARWSPFVDYIATDGLYSNTIGSRYGGAGTVNCENVLCAFSPEAKYVTFAGVQDIATIDGAGLTIGSDLTLTYLATLKGPSAYENPVMRFTRNGVETEVTGTAKGNNTYEFKYTGINAQNMLDEIKAELIGSDGTTVLDTYDGYSVYQYCLNIYGTADANLKTLISDLLVYGFAAQEYTNYKADLIDDSSEIFDTSTLYTIGYTQPTNTVKESNNTAVIKAARAVLANTNYIEFRVLGAAGMKAVINGVETEIATDDEYVRSAGILPTELEKTFTCEVIDGNDTVATAQYNLASYIANKGGDDGTLDLFEVLVQALWCFGQTASAYNA